MRTNQPWIILMAPGTITVICISTANQNILAIGGDEEVLVSDTLDNTNRSYFKRRKSTMHLIPCHRRCHSWKRTKQHNALSLVPMAYKPVTVKCQPLPFTERELHRKFLGMQGCGSREKVKMHILLGCFLTVQLPPIRILWQFSLGKEHYVKRRNWEPPSSMLSFLLMVFKTHSLHTEPRKIQIWYLCLPS